ncbi:hypothetical protein [Brevibacillus fulvus]|uniref:Uncharacterized protein n=1 Tax=Brevibacillus fulvus TaxID=1125967 RepID=A0A939BQV6_9BACL|nr:hypothetical protein [Brevibacillus fulvus]MBM7588932.1 hypothetical protein [Brevibacillus fulvus]
MYVPSLLVLLPAWLLSGKATVSTFKVENGVLTGQVPSDITGYMLVGFIPDDENKPVIYTDFLKPNQKYELKINDAKSLIQLLGQDGTNFGEVLIDYPSMKVVYGGKK